MAASPIVHISIPSHTTKSSPSIHVEYRIQVRRADGESYEILRRHRAFVALDASLRTSCALAPPPFPDYSSLIPPYLKGSGEGGSGAQSPLNLQAPLYGFLDDKFLNKRRKALENYLRSMSVEGGKVRSVWTESEPWTEFFKQDEKEEGSEPPSPSGAVVLASDEVEKSLPFRGANSYYIWALNSPDREQVLDALKGANITVLRIFIAHVNANNKGSNNPNVPDLEPNNLGEYDDTILQKIDQLMLDCSTRNIKLIIACHDRYALGFWDTDQYALRYGIVKPGTSGAQQQVNANVFYTNNECMTYFDHRIDHIMAHKNALMGNVAWGANPLGVIYSFEAENEPWGHMGYVPSSSWMNDRAGRIKEGIQSGSKILVSNGGGIDIQTSTTNDMLSTPNIDVVCVHDYSTNVWSTIQTVSTARGTANQNGKQLIFEEWGATGSGKYQAIYSWVEACYDYNIAPMIWQVVKPGANNNDFEIWTTDSDNAWGAYTHAPTGNRTEMPDPDE